MKWSFALAIIVAALTLGVFTPAFSATQKVAVLDVRLINDNEALEPTTDAERKRLVDLKAQVSASLARSGKYEIIQTPDDITAQIKKGQPIGACGGCDMEKSSAPI